jgi:hypothetical protein
VHVLCSSVMPVIMFTGCLKISSGVASATSSMLVPPAGDAMKMGPPAALQHTTTVGQDRGRREKKEREMSGTGWVMCVEEMK